jgi:hypothetical protein
MSSAIVLSTKDVEINIKADDENTIGKPIHEHRLEVSELETFMDSNFKTGLTAAEAQARLEKYGENKLTPLLAILCG